MRLHHNAGFRGFLFFRIGAIRCRRFSYALFFLINMSDIKSMETYSVVNHPPEEVIQKIAVLKKQLEDAIGWYHSVHALAHITFNVFQFRSSAISIWENYIANFVRYQQTM